MSSSEREMSFVLPSSLEEIIRTRYPNLSPFLPFLLGFAVPAPSQDHQESGEMGAVRERIVLINPSSELVIVIEGSGNLESLFRDLSNKVGPLPASKASIEAMPAVKITEEGSECAICLGEYEIGGNAKEMPCKHRYHSGCIEKWLRIHGSCPVCRYKMPVEEDESGKRSDGDEEGRRRRVEGEIRVSLFVRRGSGLGPASESDYSSSDSSRRDDAVAEDGSSIQ